MVHYSMVLKSRIIFFSQIYAEGNRRFTQSSDSGKQQQA